MQFAEEYAAWRLNAHAEIERARELELRRVIAERRALAHEQRTTAGQDRRKAEVAVGADGPVVPETVTVEAVLSSTQAVGVGTPAVAEPASHSGAEAREELHAAVR